jgi:hypothetical protein
MRWAGSSRPALWWSSLSNSTIDTPSPSSAENVLKSTNPGIDRAFHARMTTKDPAVQHIPQRSR